MKSSNKTSDIKGTKSGGREEGSGKSETKICGRCRRLFQYSGFGHLYCPICKAIDAEDFDRVKEYIYENGTATIQEVAQATNVTEYTIERYLREGRLEIPESSPIFIHCMKCNDNIKSGRFCADCASTLSLAMKKELGFDEFQIGDKPQNKGTGKMRFLDKH